MTTLRATAPSAPTTNGASAQTPFDIATKFVPAQRVVSIRSRIKTSGYRSWTLDALHKLSIATAGSRKTNRNSFSILHNHYYWDRDIDLEVCVPASGRSGIVSGLQVSVVPATRVAFTRITRALTDRLDLTIRAVEALEEYVRSEDLIFSGDPREVYETGSGDSVEIQLPVD